MRHTTITLAQAVADACSRFEELADELQEWNDAIEERFGSTLKFEQIGDARDSLQALFEPTVVPRLGNLQVKTINYNRKKLSKSDRRDEACQWLTDAMTALEELPEEDEEGKDLWSELDSLKSEAEEIEFP